MGIKIFCFGGIHREFLFLKAKDYQRYAMGLLFIYILQN